MARSNPAAPRADGRPLVLGHRGASAEAPENTMAAFRLALAQGADGVELDVWRCGSGEVVVAHDEDLRRVADSPRRLRDAPLAELRAADVGAWRGERFRGERIPLLDEVLEALPGAVVNVELKSARDRDLRLADAVARVLARAGGSRGRVLVSSFDWRLLLAFRVAAPEVPVGLLFEERWGWRAAVALAVRLFAPAAVHPDVRLVTARRAGAWARRGLAVNVWTVDPAEAPRLAALGAAAVITNEPGAARAAIRAATGR